MGELDILGVLNGASPWWWIALAVAIGAVEMLTFTYFLIWFSLAAFATGVVLWLAPGLSGAEQLAVFAVLSLALTIAGRFALSKMRATPSEAPGLNRRAEKLIGRRGKALEDFDNVDGVVVVDGVRWRARLAQGAARRDAPVTVIDADGMTLICEAD